jgi:hypothetical protein
MLRKSMDHVASSEEGLHAVAVCEGEPRDLLFPRHRFSCRVTSEQGHISSFQRDRGFPLPVLPDFSLMDRT